MNIEEDNHGTMGCICGLTDAKYLHMLIFNIIPGFVDLLVSDLFP